MIKKHNYKNILIFLLAIIFIYFIFRTLPICIKQYFGKDITGYDYWSNYISNTIGALVTIIIFVITLIIQHRKDIHSMDIFSRKQVKNENIKGLQESMRLSLMTNEFKDEIRQQLCNNYEIADNKNLTELKKLHKKEKKLRIGYVIDKQIYIQWVMFITMVPKAINKYCLQNKYSIHYMNVNKLITNYVSEFNDKLENVNSVLQHLDDDTEPDPSYVGRNEGMSKYQLSFVVDQIHKELLSLQIIICCLYAFRNISGYVLNPTPKSFNELKNLTDSLNNDIQTNNKSIDFIKKK